jgi:hypothetical protein
MKPIGVPASELSDEELERQGTQAHATRNWVFLHGTADQFERHTERQRELENEYLRRHPKRTWQGAHGGERDVDPATRLRQELRGIIVQLQALLTEQALIQAAAQASGKNSIVELLVEVAAAPGGRMHRLELHQVARRLEIPAAELALLYREEPALLTVDHADRLITDAGHAWISAHQS